MLLKQRQLYFPHLFRIFKLSFSILKKGHLLEGDRISEGERLLEEIG